MPANLLEPWLSAQASWIATMKQITDHWYERRAADIASLTQAAQRLASCKGADALAQLQSECASVLTERVMADLNGLRDDVALLAEPIRKAGLGAAMSVQDAKSGKSAA